MTPYTIAKLLRSRKRFEEELAALGREPKIVKAVTCKNPSNRGGSWKQHVTVALDAIDKIDKLLTPHGISLPKPQDWSQS